MSSGERVGWADVTDDLAGALARLRPEDAISLDAGAAFVQFIRFTKGVNVTGSSVLVHTGPGEAGSDIAAGLAALGWARWDENETLAQPEAPAPVAPDTARQLAEVIVRTLRDVHGVTDPAGIRFSSFNNNGLRAPRLRTVAPDAKQEPENPDPAQLLPAPSPEWQRWCAVFAAGLDEWSEAGLDRLAAAQGWQVEQGRRSRRFVTADGAWITAGHSDAGHYGHGEISSLSVSQSGAETQPFRPALAGAVAALGHPPLVGDEGRMPFARWRGLQATLTLSRYQGTVDLLVEPTDARETLIYNHQKWMMTPDDWSPAELWTTQPDVEAPEAKALTGMMFYSHSPSTTLDETLDELRALFGSWCEALPLLHPYASSAHWRLRRPGGDMIAEGRFTHERVTAQFGWSNEFGEPLATVPGSDVAADLVARVADALGRAGVTEPGQVRGAAWSDTGSERLDAIRLTLERG